MKSAYETNKDEIESRNRAFKAESTQLFGKIQRFLSFAVADAQRKIHLEMDFHQKRVKKQINDLEALIGQDQHWEVVHRK